MDLPKSNITLTAAELAVLPSLPGALQALADYHSAQETMTDAMNDEDILTAAVKHHHARRKELSAEADRIQKEWES